jgi:hypothetical protein
MARPNIPHGAAQHTVHRAERLTMTKPNTCGQHSPGVIRSGSFMSRRAIHDETAHP